MSSKPGDQDSTEQELSRRAPDKPVYCPAIAVSRFPYKFVTGELSQKVASHFFDKNKFWTRTWDLYVVKEEMDSSF